MGLHKKNTLLQVYTHGQLISIQDHLMKCSGMINLRLKLDLIMVHFMLLRSDNHLSTELADLFMIPQAREGIGGGDVPMLFLLLRHSKVYPLHQKQNAKNRHKCLEHSNIVMYFVIRMSESAQRVLWHFIYFL